MTWVKKIKDTWNPQEFPGLIPGDHVDFPGNVTKLVEDGDVALCDEHGNEISAYDTLGIMTQREIDEFKEWRKMQGQEALKKSLETERDRLLAEAEKIKAQTTSAVANVAPKVEGTIEQAKEELVQKKKEWGQKMAEARKKKAEEKARKLVEVKEALVNA